MTTFSALGVVTMVTVSHLGARSVRRDLRPRSRRERSESCGGSEPRTVTDSREQLPRFTEIHRVSPSFMNSLDGSGDGSAPSGSNRLRTATNGYKWLRLDEPDTASAPRPGSQQPISTHGPVASGTWSPGPRSPPRPPHCPRRGDVDGHIPRCAPKAPGPLQIAAVSA